MPAARALPLPGFDTPPAGRLAALAAAGDELHSRRQVQVKRLPARSVLNRCDSTRMPFEFTINPYRGCEFACVYCYARYTHDFLGLDPGTGFETELFAKSNAPRVLERELARNDLAGRRVAIGTVTDPYQPAERRLQLTRNILEVLCRAEGLQLSVTTKSDLILRDVDLLDELNRRHRFSVNVTVVTVDTALARRLEPRAPRPDLRLATVRELRRRGLRTGIFAMPILPAITDSRRSLTDLARAAATADASFLCTSPLFVRDCVKPTLFRFLAEQFPALLPRYRRAFARDAYLSESYASRLRARVEPILSAHGLSAGRSEVD